MAPAAASSRVPFTASQKKILLALASAVGMRMLGLFLVLPVFTLYGLQFTSSHFLVGFAFGCYGLAMAVFAIPLGRLSDRIGRRKTLILGMLIFSAGSFLCAIPNWLPHPLQITELIVGRLVQGLGVITPMAFATVADHIQEERRSTAMAVLGIPIGASFLIGVIAGPVIAGLLNTEALFWLTGALGLGTVWLLGRYLPDIPRQAAEPAPLMQILRHKGLLALSIDGFIMNAFMTAFWFYFPLIAKYQHHLKMSHYYVVLVPMLVASGVTMFGFSWGADRGWGRKLAALAFLILLVSALLLFEPAWSGLNPQRLVAVLIPGTLFLVGFTGLEPILPSLVSKAAPGNAYGTTMGSFQTFQFLGNFAGGAMAGSLSRLSPVYIMAALMAASLVGFLLIALMQPIAPASSVP